jgi:DNA-3-methyladenine glycosylase
MVVTLLSLSEILNLDSVEAAPLLLGWIICRRLPEGVVKLKIVETEAYHQNDPASHSFSGLTKRTAPMFKQSGHIYVYFTYGMHYCLNLVTGPEGEGQAVLLRAGEPIEGMELMMKNRNTSKNNISNGPGKLAQAIGIKDTSLSGEKLNKSSIWLEPVADEQPKYITSKRIGISKAVDQPWRFYLKNNKFVSKL